MTRNMTIIERDNDNTKTSNSEDNFMTEKVQNKEKIIQECIEKSIQINQALKEHGLGLAHMTGSTDQDFIRRDLESEYLLIRTWDREQFKTGNYLKIDSMFSSADTFLATPTDEIVRMIVYRYKTDIINPPKSGLT